MFFGITKAKANAKLQQAFASGDFSDAIAAYCKLIAKTPGDHELFNNLGIAYLESGALAESIEAFRTANRILPSCAHFNNLGRALLKRKDFDAARKAFLQSRAMDPKDPKPWYNTIVALREEGQLEIAFRELVEFLRVHPKHANALNDLGCAHLDRGEPRHALDCFSRAVNNDPTALSARLNLIRLLCDMKRYPESTGHLDILAKQGFQVRVHANQDMV